MVRLDIDRTTYSVIQVAASIRFEQNRLKGVETFEGYDAAKEFQSVAAEVAVALHMNVYPSGVLSPDNHKNMDGDLTIRGRTVDVKWCSKIDDTATVFCTKGFSADYIAIVTGQYPEMYLCGFIHKSEMGKPKIQEYNRERYTIPASKLVKTISMKFST